ncbi:hypothetical protein D9M70_597200 [compost metagenome]
MLVPLVLLVELFGGQAVVSGRLQQVLCADLEDLHRLVRAVLAVHLDGQAAHVAPLDLDAAHADAVDPDLFAERGRLDDDVDAVAVGDVVVGVFGAELDEQLTDRGGGVRGSGV